MRRSTRARSRIEQDPTAIRSASEKRPARQRSHGGTHSRGFARGAVGASVDMRSKEGRFLCCVERTLTDHIGGKPNAAQRMLISRAARLSLQIERMDERALTTGKMSDSVSRQYLAWTNALRLTLRELGLKGAEPNVPTLAEYIADKRAMEAAAS